MSQSSWLVAAIIPGVERQPVKKLAPDQDGLRGRRHRVWRRGERVHCARGATPSLEAEDAKRPSREGENLVGERTRIGNRIKSTLARLGIRGFKPNLPTAVQRLEHTRATAGEPLPPHALAELRREMARLRLLAEQIREIETARLERLERQPDHGGHPMI